MPRRFRTFLEMIVVFSGVFVVFLWHDVQKLPAPPVVEAVVPALAEECDPVTLLFAGDVMLGRHVRTLIETNGPSYPFARIKEDIALIAPDLFVANLEGPITELNAPDPRISPEQPYSMRFAFHPSAAGILEDAGFTHLSVANNHAFDQGGVGADDTLEHLASVGILPFGSRDGSALGTIAKVVINDREVVLIGLDTTVARHDHDALAKELLLLPDGAFVVALLHWGEEYETLHSESQQDFAHLLVDNGVDLIIGAHPHVVQDIEDYSGARIYYSLGNFVFDQYWNDSVKTGLMVKVTLDDGVTYEEFTVKSERSQPALLSID